MLTGMKTIVYDNIASLSGCLKVCKKGGVL